METKTIVAVEIASSKIKGAVGVIAPDGRLAVHAVEEMPSSGNVRYGRVQNIREVSAAVNDIITRLEESPLVAPRHICSLAVALGGRSLEGRVSEAFLKSPRECEITESLVQRLINEARRNAMTDKHVAGIVPRMYYVNNTAVRQPVGTFGESLRGEFNMLTCARETFQNLDRLKFDLAGNGDTCYVVRPTAIADLVLANDDKDLGTALVDIGAETTTVAVYKDGSLAFLCTIPMGSRLVTLDLTAGLGITEEAAETVKRNVAAGKDHDETTKNYVHARAGEIAANVLHQLELAGYGAAVIKKIVVTGGGSKLHDFIEQLEAQSKLPVHVAEMPADITFRVPGRNNPDNIDIVALLMAASKRIADSCLTQEEEVREATPEVAADNQADNDAEEDAAENDAPWHTSQADDDDDLLTDDPDDPEEEQPRSSGRFLFFGKKKKHAQQQQPTYKEEPADEPEPPQHAADPDPDPEHYKSTRRRLGEFRDKLIGMFQPPEEYSDDPDEE